MDLWLLEVLSVVLLTVHELAPKESVRAFVLSLLTWTKNNSCNTYNNGVGGFMFLAGSASFPGLWDLKPVAGTGFPCCT